MGKVYLIGAGPGDPELLTVKAARLLSEAKIVLHDSLVSREVLGEISASAKVIDVGKRCGKKLLTQDEINALLVSYSAAAEVVVRLKGGDPSIFGRAGEELEALRKAKVEFEVVPGVTSALGAAAAAGISLTDRRIASQVLFATFSRGPDANAMDWAALRRPRRWFSICLGLITPKFHAGLPTLDFPTICPARSFPAHRARSSKSAGAAWARFWPRKSCRLRR